MKVFIALVLVIGSVSARGSGPYLPRGWKPDGPAFYLPSEVAKPAPAPVQVTLLQESEASGSDAFREYGPPKVEEVSISVSQVLPDVATEQTFLTEAKNEEVVVAVQETVNAEANSEQVVAVVEEVSTVTESAAALEQAVEEVATELSNAQPTTGTQSLEVQDQVVETSEAVQLEEVKEEVVPTATAVEEITPTAAVEESIVETTAAVEEAVVPTATAEEVVVPLAQQDLVQEVAPTPVVEAVVEKVSEGVQNIAEALVTLEKEVKAVEVQAIQNVAEITTIQEASGSLEQAPEGFLEYGPPGFAEYGPPKQEDLARLSVEVASTSALENNEVRRRRYSPKFRTSKKH